MGNIIKDNINGMTFGLDASIPTYCNYIVNLMGDRQRYEDMALAAYNEFETRLNWQAATRQVTKLIEGVMR